jgi:hypothetical protein
MDLWDRSARSLLDDHSRTLKVQSRPGPARIAPPPPTANSHIRLFVCVGRSAGVRRAVHSPRRGDRPGRRAQAQGSTRLFLCLFCLALESSAVEQGAPTTSAPGLAPLCYTYVLCAPNARRLSIGMSRPRTCCCARWRAGGTCAFPTSVLPLAALSMHGLGSDHA